MSQTQDHKIESTPIGAGGLRRLQHSTETCWISVGESGQDEAETLVRNNKACDISAFPAEMLLARIMLMSSSGVSSSICFAMRTIHSTLPVIESGYLSGNRMGFPVETHAVQASDMIDWGKDVF